MERNNQRQKKEGSMIEQRQIEMRKDHRQIELIRERLRLLDKDNKCLEIDRKKGLDENWN